MKHQLLISAMLLTGSASMWAQSAFDDDIYYNPDKAKTTSVQKKESKKKQSNYIANMADMDVDAYNRRGDSYYTTSIDTIGSGVENGEDFVYTQQIQKYYNPTIVVDNADVLGDVLANAYGNVDIVIENGVPVFGPYSYAAYGWPYYSSWWASPSWRFNYGLWGWNIGFYDPWYAWGWGPSWTWGPSWGWGYGPGWGPGWGPAYRPGGWGPQPPMASWRPNGNRPAGARPGWSNNTRPGGNIAHRAPSGARPGSISGRPAGSNTRPSNTGVSNNNGRWEYNTTATSGHRKPGTGVVNSGSGQRNPSTSTVRGNNSNTNSNRNYNRNTNSNYNRNSNSSTQRNNSGSYNPSRSSGGGFGSGRSTGGGHSSGGGRGGRR